MRLSRIFIDSEISNGSVFKLPSDKAHYLQRVLRVKNGQQVLLFDGRDNYDYVAEVSSQGKQLEASIIDSIEKSCDPGSQVTILQGAGKADHIDFVVQKATELGVSSLLIFNAERTQSPYRKARLEKKLGHWQAIAESACEQCGRNRIPQIDFVMDMSSALVSLAPANRVVLDFNGRSFAKISSQMDLSQPCQLLIGPEGGFSEAEVVLAHKHGFDSCRLGNRTLRMETAALAILTLVQHFYGDLE